MISLECLSVVTRSEDVVAKREQISFSRVEQSSVKICSMNWWCRCLPSWIYPVRNGDLVFPDKLAGSSFLLEKVKIVKDE